MQNDFNYMTSEMNFGHEFSFTVRAYLGDVPYHTWLIPDLEENINTFLLYNTNNPNDTTIKMEETNPNATFELQNNIILKGKEYTGKCKLKDNLFSQLPKVPFILFNKTNETNQLIKTNSFGFSHLVNTSHSLIYHLANLQKIKDKKFSFFFKERKSQTGKIVYGQTDEYKETFHFSLSFSVPKDAFYWEIPISHIFIGVLEYGKNNKYISNKYKARFSTADPRIRVPKDTMEFINIHTVNPFIEKQHCTKGGKNETFCHDYVFNQLPDITFLIQQRAMTVPMTKLSEPSYPDTYRFLIEESDDDYIILGTRVLSMFLSEFDYDNDMILLMSEDLNFYPIDIDSLFPLKRYLKYGFIFFAVVILTILILYIRKRRIAKIQKNATQSYFSL